MAGSMSTGVSWAALVVAVAGAWLALDARRRTTVVDERDVDDMSDLADPVSLENRLNDVEARLESLEGRLQETAAAVEEANRRAGEALVMASRAAESGGGDGERGASPGEPPPGPVERTELDGLLARLRDGAVPGEDLHEVLTRARELGGLDRAVQAVEIWADGRMTDPDAQVMRGWAYTEKLLSVPEGPERGVWATKALRSYDKALRLDPRHWDAHFQRAMNLSQWPAFLGRQKDAVDGFEHLVRLQEAGPREDRFEETYFQLGNTYRSAGNVEKAKDAFRRGLEQFPDSKRLKEQMDLLKD